MPKGHPWFRLWATPASTRLSGQWEIGGIPVCISPSRGRLISQVLYCFNEFCYINRALLREFGLFILKHLEHLTAQYNSLTALYQHEVPLSPPRRPGSCLCQRPEHRSRQGYLYPLWR